MGINMGTLFKYDFYANIVHVLCSYNRKNTKKKPKEENRNSSKYIYDEK